MNKPPTTQAIVAALRKGGVRCDKTYTKTYRRDPVTVVVCLMSKPNDFCKDTVRTILAQLPFAVTEESFRSGWQHEFVITQLPDASKAEA